MEVKRSQVGWGFGLLWVLVSTVGWSVGLFIGYVLGITINEFCEEGIGSGVLGDILAHFMIAASLGSVVSLMQWLVLRRQVSRVGWWVLASTAGFAVTCGGGYVALVVVFGGEELGNFATVLGYTVVVALGGAVTGILQWLVLRAQVSRAGWWVLASTVGWGLSMAVVGAGFALEYVRGTSALWSLVGSGAVLGAVTGGALVWLLRQPVPEA